MAKCLTDHTMCAYSVSTKHTNGCGQTLNDVKQKHTKGYKLDVEQCFEAHQWRSTNVVLNEHCETYRNMRMHSLGINNRHSEMKTLAVDLLVI